MDDKSLKIIFDKINEIDTSHVSNVTQLLDIIDSIICLSEKDRNPHTEKTRISFNEFRYHFNMMFYHQS